MENENELKVGYIYKICNKNCDKIYIGSTVKSLKERFNRHKSNCKKYLETNKKYITSIEIVKDETSYIEQLAEVQFYNKKELLQKEAMFIDMYKDTCVNMYKNLGCLNKKENDKILYKQNKSKILEINKKYREENKEQIKEQKHLKYILNKQKINNKRKEKINCEYCFSLISYRNYSRHKKTCLNNRTPKIEFVNSKTIRIKIKKIL